MSLSSMLPRILAFLLTAVSAQPQSNVAEQYLLFAANQERNSRNIAPLHLDPSLTRAARQHAQQMALHHTISHRFAGEPELATRGGAAGVSFSRITENVAEAPSPITAHDAWMRSPGHRENLLDPHVDAVGIAVVARAGQLYAVQDFAHLIESLTLAEQETAVALLLDQSGLSLLPETVQARVACTGGSVQQASAQPAFIVRYTAATLTHLPPQVLEQSTNRQLRHAAVGACDNRASSPFAAYRLAILLYP